MNHQLYNSSALIPLSTRDRELEELWEEFADVPMNTETEEMEEPFLHFPAGTNREPHATASIGRLNEAAYEVFSISNEIDAEEFDDGK